MHLSGTIALPDVVFRSSQGIVEVVLLLRVTDKAPEWPLQLRVFLSKVVVSARVESADHRAPELSKVVRQEKGHRVKVSEQSVCIQMSWRL